MENKQEDIWNRLSRFLDIQMKPHVLRYFRDCFSYSIPESWDGPIADLVMIIYQREVKYKKEIRIVQVKTKFGGLRFYINGDSDEYLYGAIYMAEMQCAKICPHCGSYGKERLNTGRWNMRCVQCEDTSFEMT